MATVVVDGIDVELGDRERLNGIQAARRAGIEIPHYCWHPGLSVVASCRMCLVETGTRRADTGEVTMLPKLVPACQTPAKDGTVFVTHSEKVRTARAQVEEALLIDHPIDCPICDKAGECYLQDYHFQHGQNERRADIRPFTSRRRDVGETVTLFVDRCVMCSRCVRFTREISGTSELLVINRGSHAEIDVVEGYPLANKLSGNVVDICPVGALGDKDFLYRQRVWFMKKHASVCTGCSTGCSIEIEENQDQVYRLRPRENAFINQWWMCDEGRYGYRHVHDPNRITTPTHRDANGQMPVDWSEVFTELPSKLRSAGRLAAVLSPHLTVEEAYLLATWIRRIDPAALLVLGHVPIVGADEHFPSGFSIHAEKCPNRRGVDEVLNHFGGEAVAWDELPARLEAGDIGGAWVTGGYKKNWVDAPTAEHFARLEILVVQDLFPSPLSELATYRLPAAAFAERSGSYVNHADRLQSVSRAIRPPSGVRIEGDVFWHLLGRRGLCNSRKVLDEVAEKIAFFAPASEAVPPTGLQLKQPQPALV